MSSSHSRDYYHGSSPGSRRSANPNQSLPPLRSVLGDQLDLPVRTAGYQSPYDLNDIYKALPPSSVAAHEYRSSARPSSSMGTSHTESFSGHYQSAQSQPHRPYTYPQTSSTTAVQSSRHARPMTPGYDDFRHHPSGASHDPSFPSSSHPSDRSSQKKYVCTWERCGKRFERQNALDTHMNIHLEQKPFACPVPYCGKVFNVRSNMRRHLLTHKDYQEAGHDQNWSDEDKSAEDSYPQGSSGYYQEPSGAPKEKTSSAQYYSSSRRK